MASDDDSCQHVSDINKSEVEKTRNGLLGISTEFKKDSPFLIISATALQPETMKVPPQWQLLDNDSSSSSSLSSSAEARSYLNQVFIVKCSSCDKSVALLINGKYRALCEKLRNEEKIDGWRNVESNEDYLALFVLNQIIYREYEQPDEKELQVEYEMPHKTDTAALLWVNGNAVGFFTLKPKGTFDPDMMEHYSMTVLDTLFIRKSFRRKGYASSAIEYIIKQNPSENIGLSVPISLPMLKVMIKHLNTHPDDRLKLWEITGCGSEGNCQILWYNLKSSIR